MRAENAVEFNSSFLRSDVDISRFSFGNPITPGIHPVDLYLNGAWKGSHRIRFEYPSPNARNADPCIDGKLLDVLEVNTEKLSDLPALALDSDQQCLQVQSLIPGASEKYDVASQRMDIEIPRIFLKRWLRGYVDPSSLDSGITAATLQYDYNAYHSSSDYSRSRTSQYLGLKAGLNIGDWRFRHRGVAHWNSERRELHYLRNAGFLERNLHSMKSRLTIGESSTEGQIFDSINFRGVQLVSDDRMLPDSQRGFSPVVSGIANTNALVSISHNGLVIYETTVASGPFVIDDIHPSGQGGELVVTIREADGINRYFTVPISTLPELLSPGAIRYSLMLGEYRGHPLNETPAVFMGSIRYGISNHLTGYTGGIGTQGYRSLLLGMALNTPLGAFAIDATRMNASFLGEEKKNANRFRIKFSEQFPGTGTRLFLSSQIYSPSGFYPINEALGLKSRFEQGILSGEKFQKQKYRSNISLSQSLPAGYGAFMVNASHHSYWKHPKSNREYLFNYTNLHKGISYTASAQRSYNTTIDRWDNRVMLSFSVPLGKERPTANLNIGMTKTSDGYLLNSSINGKFGEEQKFDYSLFANHSRINNRKDVTTFGGSSTWRGPSATIGGNFSSGKDYTQYGASISGGVVVYSEGVVFAPTIGETIAIVEAKDGQGARISGHSDLRLDENGKTVLPFLRPYRQNTVEIDPKGLTTDIEFKTTMQNIAPSAGAVSLLHYETEIGYSLLLIGEKADGTALTFGAPVIDETNRTVGHIGQGGQALIRVQDAKGNLRVKWGEKAAQMCSFDYELPALRTIRSKDLVRLDITCR